MKVIFDAQDVLTSKSEGVVLFTYEDGSDAEERFRTKLGPGLTIARQRKEFEGKPKQQWLEKQPATPRFYLLVGLGKKNGEGKATIDAVRAAAAVGAETMRNLGAKSITIEAPPGDMRYAQAVTEGAMLRTYQYTAYKTKRDDIKEIDTITVTSKAADAAQMVERGRAIAESCNLARDLQNAPSSDMTPRDMANAAVRLAKEERIACTVLDKGKLTKQGYNGLLSVGRGSMNDPYLVTLEYAPKGAKRTVAVVGKGMTFDSGGISIKPSAKMGDMKFDMSGAASVLGIMRAASRLKLPVRVIGVLCLAENMPDGAAYKPGDVVRTKAGKTIEIDNTDAEGRVVLADGLYHANTFKPDAIIDMATLTGAAVVALGDVAAAALGTNQAEIDRITEAAGATGEKVWQLPLWDDYADDIKSQIADMKNVGMQGMAGTIAGAMLLKEFVGETPWVHLDIAGVAWAQGRERYFTPYGGTGYGVRLLTEYLQQSVEPR